MTHRKPRPPASVKPRSKNSIGRGKTTQREGRGRHRKPEKIYDFTEADNRIYDIFRHHDFGDYPHEKRHQLTRFYQILMQHQHKDNVTRLLTLRDVAIKHFIDCLMVDRFVDLRFPLMDMGTGPGFPGIPLKIHYPDRPILLVEGVERRVQFLKAVRDELNLKELNIIGRYVNTEFEYPIHSIITRAVSDVSDTLLNVSQCLQVGGYLYLMKGPNVDKEIVQAKEKWGQYYRLMNDIPYEIPSTPHQRRLLVYEKINHWQRETE